jgi:hypothetical protein
MAQLEKIQANAPCPLLVIISGRFAGMNAALKARSPVRHSGFPLDPAVNKEQ